MVYSGLVWNQLRFYVIIHKCFLANFFSNTYMASSIFQLKKMKKNPGLKKVIMHL